MAILAQAFKAIKELSIVLLIDRFLTSIQPQTEVVLGIVQRTES